MAATAASKKQAAAKVAAQEAVDSSTDGTDVFDALACRSYAIAPLDKAIDEAGIMANASPELRLILDFVKSNRDQLAFIGGVVNKLSGKAGAAASTAGASKYK